MTAINWRATQQRLQAAGYDPQGIDNIAGGNTFAALIAHQAQRQPDATIRAIAGVAATMLPLFGWTADAERLAEFLAQAAHESAGFSAFTEKLNYSAERLMAVWPSRFPSLSIAAAYAGDPERLANFVYAGRMGNGSPESGDGWRYRGGGLLQHTGAAEYEKLRERLGFTPDDVRDPAKSVIAACDYLARARTHIFIDRGDWACSRKSVNGGTIGLAEVETRRLRSLKVLA